MLTAHGIGILHLLSQLGILNFWNSGGSFMHSCIQFVESLLRAKHCPRG